MTGQGTLSSGHAAVRAIGDQKRSEESLRRLSRYFDLSRDMVCTTGLDGYFKHLNGMWTEALGWSDAELRSRPMVSFVHPDDRQATLDERARMSERGTTVAFVNRCATKDGGWRWIDWNTRYAPDEQLFYATARDITERRDAESKARFQANLLDAVAEAVITTDLTGTIMYWGPGAEALYGWKAHDALSRSITDVVPVTPLPGAASAEEIMARLCRGEPHTGIMVLGRQDGSTFVGEVTDTPVLDDSGQMVAIIGISSDVSVREEAHAELKRAHDQALEASLLKSHFLTNMSHEIRTPMNGVLGMTELLLDTSLDARQRYYAEAVRTSGDALLAIIDDILDLSKIEAGHLKLEVVDFDLPVLIDDVGSLLAGAAQAKGLELVIDIGDDVPAVRGDPGRLRQVLTNLLGNAVKFTPAGQVTVAARVTASTDAGTTVQLRVDDTGIGVAPEAASKIFEPFGQADSSNSRRYGGTGLGLAITRQLVELMGGHCGFESRLGTGSSFWVTLTLPRALADVRPQPPVLVLRPGRGRILLVEDSVINQQVAMAMLDMTGYTVDLAENGGEAVRAVQAGSYEVVLMDCQMPEMDGYAAAAAIRAGEGTGRRLPIIAMTAGAMQQDRDRAMAAGMDDYLVKPVTREEVLAKLALWGAA